MKYYSMSDGHKDIAKLQCLHSVLPSHLVHFKTSPRFRTCTFRSRPKHQLDKRGFNEKIDEPQGMCVENKLLPDDTKTESFREYPNTSAIQWTGQSFSKQKRRF